MTTASEIINRAYREPNIVGVGKTPTAAEIAEALPLLNTITQNAFGRLIGTYTKDWPIGTFYTAPTGAQWPFYPNDSKPSQEVWRYPPPNVKLLCRLASATTVYFPSYPDDGAQMVLVDNGNDWVTNPLTIDFNGRSGVAANGDTTPVTTITYSEAPTAPITWVYRADLSRWEIVPDITVGTETMPLAEEFDDWFAITLAGRLAPRYSKQLPDLLILAARDLEKQMKTRFKQSPKVNTHRRGEDQRTVQSYSNDGFSGVAR
jgi:hypothetical protein